MIAIHDESRDIADRLPPASLEAERGVIAAALMDPSTLHETADILTPGDFYRDSHEAIFRAILGLYNDGRTVDAITLADELTRRGTYRHVGGDEALREISESVPHAANAGYHARIVREMSVARQLVRHATDIIRDCYRGEATSAELLASAESRIYGIGEREAVGSTASIGEAAAEAAIAIQGREHDDGAGRGVRTGYAELDFKLDSLKPGEVTVLAARPSQGKTALAMGIAVAVAGRHPGTVLFVSLEMSRQALAERLLSSIAGVPGEALKRPRGMAADDRRRLHDAAKSLESLRLHIDDTPCRNLTQIGANARRTKARGGLSLVVIDYLSLIDGDRRHGENRQEEVARMSRRLKSLARELDVPVLCLHQLNRQSEARKDRRPMLADLRESGQVEQDADVVMLIHRPEYYDPADEPGIAEVIVAKNRNGPTGTVKLAFVKSCTRFDSLDSRDMARDGGAS